MQALKKKEKERNVIFINIIHDMHQLAQQLSFVFVLLRLYVKCAFLFHLIIAVDSGDFF